MVKNKQTEQFELLVNEEAFEEPSQAELVELEDEEVCEDMEVTLRADYYSDDIMQTLINEMGQTKLLTQEEELKLGKLIMEGSEEEAKEAKDKLVLANRRLAFHYAKKYVGKGVDLPDLYMMGIEGLYKAVNKYDYKLEYKFSTYASWWIRQTISRGLDDESSAVRIPVHKRELIYKISKFQKEFFKLNGYEASFEEIADGVSEDLDKIKEVLSNPVKVISFEAEVGDEGDSTLEEFLRDENATNPVDVVLADDLHNSLELVLDKLSDKEAKVLRLRSGLSGGRPMTLEEIANLPEFGVTRERIRQIEERALNKIRRNVSSTRLLKGFAS